MTWKRAHSEAMLYAARALSDFGEDQKPYVDVFAALNVAGITVMARPMPRLFGAYLSSEQGGPGVLVNSGLDEPGMRHTAAHELGHFMFGHSTRGERNFEVLSGNPERNWSLEEKQAESFAAWFLMPRRAVRSCMRNLGLSRVNSAADVLQLSLWLGTTYRGTVRHLSNLRMISSAQATEWLRRSPRQIGSGTHGKKRIWRLGPAAAGATLHVQVGDRLEVFGETGAARPALCDLHGGVHATAAGPAQPAVSVDVTPETGNGTVTFASGTEFTAAWKIHLAPVPVRDGCADAWLPGRR